MGNILDYINTVQSLLISSDWKTSGERIFASGSVLPTLKTREELFTSLRPPVCLFGPVRGTANPQHPGYQHFTVRFQLIHFQAGDQYGNFGLMGRSYPAADVANAGILELAEEIKLLLQQLDRGDSSGLVMNAFTDVEYDVQLHPQLDYVYYCNIDFTVRCVTE